MICELRNLGVAVMLVGATVATVLAQDAPVRVASGQREILLQADQSWNGKPYTHYPTGQPQLTTIKLTIAPHTALPWHTSISECSLCAVGNPDVARQGKRQDTGCSSGTSCRRVS